MCLERLLGDPPLRGLNLLVSTIVYYKNEWARAIVAYKKNCGWKIHACPLQKIETYIIKKAFEPTHKCSTL